MLMDPCSTIQWGYDCKSWAYVSTKSSARLLCRFTIWQTLGRISITARPARKQCNRSRDKNIDEKLKAAELCERAPGRSLPQGERTPVRSREHRRPLIRVDEFQKAGDKVLSSPSDERLNLPRIVANVRPVDPHGVRSVQRRVGIRPERRESSECADYTGSN